MAYLEGFSIHISIYLSPPMLTFSSIKKPIITAVGETTFSPAFVML